MTLELDRASQEAASIDGTRRVVLLGASNLTKGIATVVATAHRLWGQPLEVLSALGHGRSYGRTSSVLGRQLPGILGCGLWDAMARSPQVPTAALVTDIGNDLLYEEPVDEIAVWVEQCLERLAAAEARTVVTLLPVENLASLSRARFYLMRTVFVPRSRITLEEVHERATALNERVRRMARERGFGIVEQRASWYGFDPIHIKFGQRPGAWREILSSWSTASERVEAVRGSVAHSLYLRTRRPHERRVFGFAQRGLQPAARLSDGTTLAIY